MNGRAASTFGHSHSVICCSILSWAHRARGFISLVSAPYHPPTAVLALQQLGSFETIQRGRQARPSASVQFHGIFDEEPLIPFQDAWELQQNLQQAHFDGTSDDDTILLVQHPPVFTFGTRSDPAFLLEKETEIPVVNVNRGGEITYHGPGQLVMYPVIDLRNYQPDLHWYMRALEEAVMLAVTSLLQASAGPNSQHVPNRCEDTTGVWLDDHKIAAIGVHARRWVTQHGVAINVEEGCLKAFGHIVPCGLAGRKVGCLNQFLVEPMTVADFVPFLLDAIEHVFQMKVFAGPDHRYRTCRDIRTMGS